MDKKTYQFIHPQTSEVFVVDGTKVIEIDGYWILKMKNNTVAIFTKNYSFVIAQ
jgi:hypothetical protein